jgi:imidazolonepropionase-like amidohydrolase
VPGTPFLIRAIRPMAVLLAAGLGLSACRTTPATHVGPVSGNSFIVRDVRVFDGTTATERTNVVVRNGRITEVGAALSTGLETIDGRGKTLLPGLIDAHAHVPNVGHLRNALRFGVTTTLDMLTRPEFAATQRSRRDSIVRTDLADMYSAGVPITSPGGMGTQFGIPLTTISAPGEADGIVAARIAEGSDYLKVMYEPGAGIVTTISEATLGAVIAAARARGKVSVAHVSSIGGARGVARAGADGLAHVFSDSVIDPDLAEEIARRKLFVIPTLSIHHAFEGGNFRATLAADERIAPFLTPAQRAAQTGPPPSTQQGPMAPYLARFSAERAMENVRRLHRAGVTILAGDDAASNLAGMGVSLHGELELLTMAGLSPAEALHAATAGPAAAFRLADRGRIAPGARADLVLVEGNPLDDIRATRAIARIFKNGFEVSRTPPANPAQQK